MNKGRVVLVIIVVLVVGWWFYPQPEIHSDNPIINHSSSNNQTFTPPPIQPSIPLEEPSPKSPEPAKPVAPVKVEDKFVNDSTNLTKFNPLGFQSRPPTSRCGAGDYNATTGECTCDPGAVSVDGRCKEVVELCGLDLFGYDTGSSACQRSLDCASIDSMEWRDDCHTLSAIQISDCESLEKPENKKRCRDRFSANQPAISIPCERIKDIKQKDLCLMTLGILALDDRVCRLIDRSGKKEDCLAQVESAISSCLGQPTPEDINSCYTSIASQTMNPQICGRIADLRPRKACEVQAKRGVQQSQSSPSDFGGVTLVR